MADFSEHGNGLLPYLDIPLQHSHPEVLKRMKRPAGGEKTISRIANWRVVCPDIVIRSTFIAGFPGETEEEFEHLLSFIEEAQLDRVGCFAYSPVKGAKANELSNPLPDEVREERRARFMQTAEQISTQKLNKVIGKRIRVLVDSVNAQGGIARSFADAPEIDGLVYVQPPERPSKRYRSGEFIKVTVANTQGHDLIALP
jgi:ribosomal protein S12 methylthiotransferase